MASWTLNLYFSHRIASFLVQPTTRYDDLLQTIRRHWKLSSEKVLIEVYDQRFRKYLILDDEYLVNLQDRLPKTNRSALNGRLRFFHTSVNSKHQRTSSCSIENDQFIVWFDQVDSARELKHRFSLTTMLDFDNPLQSDLPSLDKIKYFNDKDQCLAFLQSLALQNIKVLFITSDCSSEEIVPLVSEHVQMIYVYRIHNSRFSYEWTCDYLSNLLVFDDNNHCFVRVIRDLAENFLEKAEMISNRSARQAIHFFKRSKKLFHRANQFAEPSFCQTLHRIDDQIASLERNINDRDEQLALECSEG